MQTDSKIRVQLKQAAHLGGQDWRPGAHALPASVVKESLFKWLLKDGKIVMLDQPVTPLASADVSAGPTSVSPLADPVDPAPDRKKPGPKKKG